MASSPLACTVRGCGLPLEQNTRTYVCARGHSYDIARSGYINLLQPQDRRSLIAGDSSAAVEARARLLTAGVGTALIEDVLRHSGALPLPPDGIVADLGSGSGDAVAAVARERSIAGIGIDLSTAAARHAARRFPEITWVVANADRRLPLIDHRLALLLSLHGRRNPAECARVLGPAGFLLVAIPAAVDLIELRATVQGSGVERSRVDAVLTEHQPLFTLVERFSTRERHTLERPALVDLLRSTYRGARTSHGARVDSLTSLDVTLASECLLFARF